MEDLREGDTRTQAACINTFCIYLNAQAILLRYVTNKRVPLGKIMSCKDKREGFKFVSISGTLLLLPINESNMFRKKAEKK